MLNTLLTESSTLPKHVAIIMDGNGRWAQSQGLSRIQGHQAGAETTIKIVEEATRLGIEYTTLYAFSSENWSRPATEVSALMGLLASTLEKYLHTLTDNDLRLHVIGRISELPVKVQKAFQSAIDRTAHNTGRNLVLALNYGSRLEVMDAAQRYAQAVIAGEAPVDKLSWDTFSQYLYTANMPEPDLIIRTSGEVRLSNFLMLQAAYAELYFTDTPWPAFSAQEFRKAVTDFQNKQRRFGKTSEQIQQEAFIASFKV